MDAQGILAVKGVDLKFVFQVRDSERRGIWGVVTAERGSDAACWRRIAAIRVVSGRYGLLIPLLW